MKHDAVAVGAAVVFGGPILILLAVLVYLLTEPARDWWSKRRQDLSGRIAGRLDGAHDIYAEDTQDLTQTQRQIAAGWRVDGSHDHDPDMEPGVRLCEIDRLERLYMTPEETTWT